MESKALSCQEPQNNTNLSGIIEIQHGLKVNAQVPFQKFTSTVDQNADQQIDHLPIQSSIIKQFNEDNFKPYKDGHLNEAGKNAQGILDFLKIFRQTDIQLKPLSFLEKQVLIYWNSLKDEAKDQELHFLLTKIYAFLLLSYFQIKKDEQGLQNLEQSFKENVQSINEFINVLALQVKINQRKGSHEEALLQLNLILKIISSVDKKYPRHCLLKNRYLASLMPFLDCEQLSALFQEDFADTLTSLKNQFTVKDTQSEQFGAFRQELKVKINYYMRSKTLEHQKSLGNPQQSFIVQEKHEDQQPSKVQTREILHMPSFESQNLLETNKTQVQGAVSEIKEVPKQLDNTLVQARQTQNTEQVSQCLKEDEYHRENSVITQGKLTNTEISFLDNDHSNDHKSYSSSKKLRLTKIKGSQKFMDNRIQLSHSYECPTEPL